MSKPDLRTVVCNATVPRSLPDARFVAAGEQATSVDVSNPEVRALIEAGDLAVVENARKSRGRKPTTKESEEAAK